MSPEVIATIYGCTAVGVGVILAAAGLGSALGWGMICSKYIEGIARQPELRAPLSTYAATSSAASSAEYSFTECQAR